MCIQIKNVFFILCVLAGSIGYANAETKLELGSPEGLPEIIQSTDAQGNFYNQFFPNGKSLTVKSSGTQALLSGSWFDSGNGPGVLPYQGQWYFSDILGTASASGYMNTVNYQWSGSFNGWTGVYVYLFILDNSGNIVANANVTGATSDSLSVPASTFPADYELVFGYIVDRPLVLRIYNGPSFGYVSANVLY